MRIPLTSAQSAIFHHQCQNEASAFYNVGGYIDLDRPDVDRIRVAHARLVDTFEVFRLRIGIDEDGVFQTHAPAVDAELPYLDFSTSEDPQAAAAEWLDELFGAPIAMERCPLFRAALLRLSDERFFYVGMGHHVALDGVGFVNWATALSLFYEDPEGRWLVNWPDLPNEQLVSEDRAYLGEARRVKDLAFWDTRLSRFNDAMMFVPRAGHHADGLARSARAVVPLTSDMRARLSMLAELVGAEHHQVLLALLALHVGMANSAEAVVVATPLHGRHSDSERCKIGLLTQMLPLLVELDGDQPFSNIVQGLRRSQRELLRHRRLPVNDIVNHPKMPRSRNQLFDIGYSYLPVGASPVFDGVPSPLTYCSHNHEQIPLLLTYWDVSPEARGTLLFDHRLDYFSATDVKTLVDRMFSLLDEILSDATRPVGMLSCLTPVEHGRLREMAAQSQADRRPRFDFEALFASHVARSPHAIAIEGAFGTVDYAALNQRVHDLAGYLQARLGIGEGDRVGVYLPRSAELLVALLALVRLGATYVPVDPQSPSERTRHILGDSGARWVLAQPSIMPLPGDVAICRVVDIDAIVDASSGDVVVAPPPGRTDGELYVLYTSGSTGVPKGVLVGRAAVMNLLQGVCERLDLDRCDRWFFMSSVAFDISIVEWLGCLAMGRTCVLPSDDELADPFALAERLNGSAVAFMQATPSRLKQLRQAGWRPSEGMVVMSAGEALGTDLVEDLLSCEVVLWNGYGPTEATVYSLVKRVSANEQGVARVAIGDQLPGYRHYVVNARLRPVPAGTPGELVIAGDGLAVGYVNRHALTEERFVRGGHLPETRFYRTGDVVRFLGEGLYQYLGRNDDQIKLRGYRIELDEITNAMLSLPLVSDAAVVHRKADAGRPAQLLAYVCLASPSDDDVTTKILDQLARSLPAYMLPTSVTVLQELPVNTNGKLDKRRLPEPVARAARIARPLTTETERAVASVWAELLARPVEDLAGQDDFFALGGDSVLAVRAVVRLRQELRRKLDIGDVFRHARLSEFAARLDELPAWDGDAGMATVDRSAADFPASVMQQQMWYMTRRDPDAARYNMPVAWRISGAVQPDLVEHALRGVVSRHEALRTLYRETAEGLRQVVLADAPFLLHRTDGSSWSESESAAMLVAVARRHANHAFALDSEIPLRGELVSLAAGDSVLLLNLHHIAGDGASIGVLLKEFLALYDAMAKGTAVSLPAPGSQYVDFAAWQRDALARGAWDGQLSWWLRALADAPHTHALPLDRSRPKWPGSHAVVQESLLPAVLVKQVADMARRLSVTEFCLLQSVFALMVCRWSYSDEVVIGSPVSGRVLPGLERAVGVYVNLLAHVHAFDGHETFAGYLARFQRSIAEALDHQQVPFDRIVDGLRRQGDPGCHPVFQLMFAFQDDVPDRLLAGGLRLDRIHDTHASTRFDVELLVTRKDGDWTCRWIAASDLFDLYTLSSMAASYLGLLERVLEAPEALVGSLGLSQPARDPHGSEASTVVDAVAAHQLVERQAASRGEATAVRFGSVSLSYRELNDRANRLAHVVSARGLLPGSRVALYLPRGVDLIVATLAVLKSGCAYVPVDPTYPPARQAYLLDDASPALVLSTTSLMADHPIVAGSHAVACLDDSSLLEAMASAPGSDRSPEQVGLTSESTAYVVYTSGSTGKPKGVVIPHRGLVNLAIAQSAAFGIDATSSVLQFASFSFDAATSEWVTALSSGGVLVMVPEDVIPDMQALTAWSAGHEVTHATLPPVVLRRLQPSAWPSLRCVISAGEAISIEEAQRWAVHCRFINAYGPSESTVCATIGGIHDASGRVVIGKALDGLHLHVLDKWLNPVVPGAVGELCISGVGLATGYLGREDLTRSRFVALAHGDATVTAYRTGDRVRELPDGNLVFEGRIDEQVKIRGHRVECAEIEACIAAYGGVGEVAVRTRKMGEGDLVLAAYVAIRGDRPAEDMEQELRRHLASELPGWMVPTFIVIVGALPLTVNGKLDTARLDAIAVSAVGQGWVRALSSTERAVKAIWDESLGATVDDPDRGFFESGGHSLAISDVLGRLEARFGVRPSYREFFEHASIAGLAALVDAHRSSGEIRHDDVPPLPVSPAADGAWPLSFEQQRIWFIDQMEEGSVGYNMPVALMLEGQIATGPIEAALGRIVERHESLRTVFVADDMGVPRQEIRHAVAFRLERMASTDEEPAERIRRRLAEERSRPFDLTADLMLRAAILPLSSDRAVLFLTLHHIAADGRSIDNLIGQFRHAYADIVAGGSGHLPELPCQYKQLALAQRVAAENGALIEGVNFWSDSLAGAPHRHSLPRDADTPPAGKGQAWTTLIPDTVTRGLGSLSRSLDTSLFVTTQTLFAAVLARWSEHHDVLMGTPIVNRHRAEAAELIGFFANTLVMRTDCRGNPTFRELIVGARENFAKAFEYQHVPFDVLVDHLAEGRDTSYGPLVQVLFSLQEDPATKLSRLKLPSLAFGVVEEDGDRPVKFELELMLSECEDGMTCQWLFDASVFSRDTIGRLFESFMCLLREAVADPDGRVHDVDIVSGQERAMLLAEPTSLPDHVIEAGSLGMRFAHHARRRPDATAVVHGDARLTYGELDERSSQLANWIASRGLVASAPVALYMKRGIELVVAVLAVMKAGLPYLPLDLGYPSRRVAHILADSGATLALSDATTALALRDHVGDLDIRCMDDEAFLSEVASQPSMDLPEVDGDAHIYFVYTSGSTGQPKGVMVRRAGFLNLVGWYIHDYAFDESDRCLLIGSIGFDMTQKNLFAPLVTGGILVIPDEHFDPTAIATLVQAHGVTVINCVPSAAYQIVENPDHWSMLASLRLLGLGGEAIRLAPLRPWLTSKHCYARLLNMYGPSECTDIAIATVEDAATAAARPVTVPIGRPIHGCKAYVLNGSLKLQPQGVMGELYLGGAGVSDGYVGLPELNARCFLDGILPGGGRLYRTGDLAKIGKDGNFHYMGRADHQVKIRGYRVETAEIDAVITGCADVQQAITLVREGADGDRSLVSFVVPVAAAGRESERIFPSIRKVLLASLPAYMLPARFIPLDGMPLTPNGKVDKLALGGLLDLPGWAHTRTLRAPVNDTETRMLGIWRDLLQREDIGIDDDFFEMGGHSLIATRLASRVNREFGLEDAPASVKEFFHHTTIEAASRLIEAKRRYGALRAREAALLDSDDGIAEGTF